MHQFYLNFRHIFRCNLRESWRAMTQWGQSQFVFAIQFLFLTYRFFFLKWDSSVLYQFSTSFLVAISENHGEPKQWGQSQFVFAIQFLFFMIWFFISNMRCVSFISILYTIFVAMSENLRKHEVPHSALHSNAKANSNSQF